MTPVAVILMTTVLGLLTGMIQVMIGFLGVGTLIKYIPYPVVSGYLSGVGLILIGSQLPRFAGAPMGSTWVDVLLRAHPWDWRGLVIGCVTAVVMLVRRVSRVSCPAPSWGLSAGIAAYAGIAFSDPSLMRLEGNTLVVGPLGRVASDMSISLPIAGIRSANSSSPKLPGWSAAR